jgi:chromosome segregation protein
MSEQARLRNVGEALERRRQELYGQRMRLEEEQRALGARLDANARDRESARAELQRLAQERELVAAERNGVAAERRVVTEEERRATTAVEGARDAATQLSSRADSLRELQARYEGCTRGTASLLGRGAGGQLLADVLRVPAELERAVAAALGARLQHVVVPATADAVDAIRWLRTTEGGTATALPRDAERRAAVIVPPGRRLVDALGVEGEHWALAESLLGDVLIADDLDRALELWREAAHPVTVVTLAGEAIDPLGAVTGGSEAPLEETLLARGRELRGIESALVEAQARVAKEAARLEAVRAHLRTADESIAALDERLQGLRVAEVAAGKDRERLEDDRTRIAAELEVGALEASGLAGADGEVSGELAAMAERGADTDRGVEDARANLAARQRALGGWRDEIASAERHHTEVAVRATQAAERLRAAEAASEAITSALADLCGRLAETEALAVEGGEAIARATSDHIGAECAREEATASAGSLGEERGVLVAGLAEADAALAVEDREERAARERIEELRARRVDVERELTERRFAMQGIQDRLLERYGVGLDALASVAADAEPVGDEEAGRAEEIRARIARLGDVNPGAMAEYDEIRQRHEFLSQQRADLERSLEDLRQTIAKPRAPRASASTRPSRRRTRSSPRCSRRCSRAATRGSISCRARREVRRASRSSCSLRARSSSR